MLDSRIIVYIYIHCLYGMYIYIYILLLSCSIWWRPLTPKHVVYNNSKYCCLTGFFVIIIDKNHQKGWIVLKLHREWCDTGWFWGNAMIANPLIIYYSTLYLSDVVGSSLPLFSLQSYWAWQFCFYGQSDTLLVGIVLTDTLKFVKLNNV